MRDYIAKNLQKQKLTTVLDIVQQNNMLGIVLVSQSQYVSSMMKRDCLNACGASFIYTDRRCLWFLSFITLLEMFCMFFCSKYWSILILCSLET